MMQAAYIKEFIAAALPGLQIMEVEEG